MKYDFDRVILRKGTNSLKYDFAKEKGMPEDLLPMWVADMDLEGALPIREAVISAAKDGIFGYSDCTDSYKEAVCQWYRKHFSYSLHPETLVNTPGVVYAIATAIRAYTKKGDGVLLMRPVYYPFQNTIEANERIPVNCPLRQEKDGRYRMDYDAMEAKMKAGQVSLLLLCSPHNPVSRVWEKEELKTLADLCLRYHVMVVADEIHSDFVFPGRKHTIWNSLSPEIAGQSILCTAPSKTFNIAGLQASNIFIENKKYRELFQLEMKKTGYDQINQMGFVACEAAYREGEEWYLQMLDYLWGNMQFMEKTLEEKLPLVKLTKPEGTYLAWVDLRKEMEKHKETEEQMQKRILEKAKLWLDEGTMFGPEGAGFWRFNVACPRKILDQALTQLAGALEN